MWLNTPKKLSWVTLIEVVFAIIVFGTWILVVLSTITTNIRRLYDINEKDTALSIAKEWIDIVYHVRDSNLERWAFWDCAEIDLDEASTCGRYFYDWTEPTKHIIEFDKDWLYSMDAFTTTWNALIYYHTWTIYTLSGTDVAWFWYNHDNTWEQTIYTRIIEFRELQWYEAYTWFVLELTSRVLYDRSWGQDPNEVVLQSIIWDIR